MTYKSHLRITLSGTFGLLATPVETWTTSFAIAENAGVFGYVGFPSQTQQDAVVTAASAWFGRATSLFSTVQHLRTVKFSIIGENGRVPIDPATGAFVQSIKTLTTPTPGTVSTGMHPLQTALVATLQSKAAGPTGRGRMFLPVHCGVVDGNGMLGAGDQQGIANSLVTFLAAARGAVAYDPPHSGDVYPLAVVVPSQGSVLKGLAPANRPVTSVRVGRVHDTMRSRRKNLAEQYYSAAL